MHQKEKNNTICDLLQANLFAFQERQLSKEMNSQLEEHLKSCQECADLFSDFLSFSAIIDQKKNLNPNPFSATRILQHIESQIIPENTKRIPQYSRILQSVTFSFLMIFAVLVGFSIINLKKERFPSSDQRQSNIQSMKSDLNIADFIDEDKTLFEKP